MMRTSPGRHWHTRAVSMLEARGSESGSRGAEAAHLSHSAESLRELSRWKYGFPGDVAEEENSEQLMLQPGAAVKRDSRSSTARV